MTQKSHTKRHSKKIPINIQTIRKERVGPQNTLSLLSLRIANEAYFLGNY